MVVFWGILAVLLSLLLALAGLYLVQRLVPLRTRESANTAIGAIYAALYVIFGITLAFSLYIGRQEVDEVQQTTEREAGGLENLYQLADQLPQPKRGEIQALDESYLRVVVEEEWPSLEQGGKNQQSTRAEALMDELQESVLAFEPTTDAEQTLYSEGVEIVYAVEEEREIRLLEDRQDVHTYLWYLLVVGGVLTVSHAFFFGTEVLWLHRLSVAALTILVVFLLYATYQVQYPFSGGVRVGSDAYAEALDGIKAERKR